MFTRSSLLMERGVETVFSDREGGCSRPPYDSLNLGSGLGDTDSNIRKNLQLLCQASSLPVPHQATQVHGDTVLHCFGSGKVHATDADILITSDSQVALAVRTADCLPILLKSSVKPLASAMGI
ncbi:MAG: laccase domain-containing protein [Ghiorsea sp.]